MKLTRKLQITYLLLLVGPVMIVGLLIVVTYFIGGHIIGPFSEIDGPGFIKSELSLIIKKDWDRYSDLREHIVIFIFSEDGTMVFPEISDRNIIPADYPLADQMKGLNIFQPGSISPEPSGLSTPISMIDVFEKYGTKWSYGLYITPFSLNGERYTAGWQEPIMGFRGFIARKGWFFPLFIITFMMIIPVFGETKLRKSIQRLQKSALRIREGDFEQPVPLDKRDNLVDLAESLEDVRVKLKDGRDQGIRYLMAVSHDLRTPLTSIKGYIEALGDGLAETPEDYARYLAILADKATLLENRIGELIDFSRAMTGGVIAGRTFIDVADFFFRLDADFRTEAGFSGRKYVSELSLSGGVIVEGNAEALYRAWENLFINAVRHTEEGSRICLRIGIDDSDPLPGLKENGESRRADAVLFGEIEDDGEGVDEAFVPLLFEPFSRADKGRNSDGLGLGLAAAKFVAKVHGGDVDYRPSPGGGAIFRIRIPCRLPE